MTVVISWWADKILTKRIFVNWRTEPSTFSDWIYASCAKKSQSNQFLIQDNWLWSAEAN